MPLPDVPIPLCAGCGACCHLTVELAETDRGVPPRLTAEHEGVRYMDQRGNGACVALDPVSRRCTIYEDRPAVCRAFERASARCQTVLARGAARLERFEA